MKPVVFDLAAGAVHAAAITVLLVMAIHSAGIREAFRYSGWMLAAEIAAGFLVMCLLAFTFGGVFQLLSRRFDPIPPVVDDGGLQERSR